MTFEGETSLQDWDSNENKANLLEAVLLDLIVAAYAGLDKSLADAAAVIPLQADHQAVLFMLGHAAVARELLKDLIKIMMTPQHETIFANLMRQRAHLISIQPARGQCQ